MKTIIIKQNEYPLIPKGLILSTHERMPLSTFYPEFFRLMEIDKKVGCLIMERGYINLNAKVLDHFIAHKEDIPEQLKIEGTVYCMGTMYNQINKSTETREVRSITYNVKEQSHKEGKRHFYNQEFDNSFALVYDMQKHTAYEMGKLEANIGKKVRIFTTELGEYSLAEYFPDGYVATLKKVKPGEGIQTNKKEKLFGTEETHGIFPFIGPKDGITKVISETTGEVLYENLTLVYDNNRPNHERLLYVNMFREIKYGTNEYKLEKIPLI